MYTDGITPDELAARTRTIRGVNWFLEDDLTKQDRQTDDQMLDLEFALYEFLGVHQRVLQSWRSIHNHWRWKSNYFRGILDQMRLTGQATTALGNVIVNMFVHWRFVIRNQCSILAIYMLGDDNLMLMSTEPDTTGLRKEIADYYNMMSKATKSTNEGVFCCLMCYKHIDGYCEFGPDIVRLRNRFEVTNGVSKNDIEVHKARALSYLFMLGANQYTNKIARKINNQVTLPIWYDQQQAFNAASNHYGQPIETTQLDYQKLLDYLDERNVTTHKIHMWTIGK